MELGVRFWLSGKISAGIARSESRIMALVGNDHPSSNVTTVIVTSFEKK
jgi:hypothetical protein